MKLVIAEKPSMGRDIASFLGVKSRAKGYIECRNDYTVTWALGHVLKQAEPEFYVQADERGKKYWKAEELPIVPKKWILQVIPSSQDQYAIIQNLLKECDSVVHAGDPGREGQLLVDEILVENKFTKPVQRILLDDLSDATMKRAFENIQDNEEFKNIYESARARQEVDWLVGNNLTRAFCIGYNKRTGDRKLLSYGRVQTPTLALIVDRETRIKNFVSKDFFKPFIIAKHAKGSFKAQLITNDTVELDPEGYLVDEKVVQDILKAIDTANGEGKVLSAEYKKKKKEPPLPHDLGSIQKEASRKFGYSPTAVLDLMQSLYEKKCSSYPRTDCRYLPEERFEEHPKILEMLKRQGIAGSDKTESRKTAAWNTKKVEEHNGFMPVLGANIQNLTEEELNMYTLVAESYIRLFMPDKEYEERKIVLEMGANSSGLFYQWRASASTVLSAGWTCLTADIDEDKEEEEEEESTNIPKGIKKNDAVFKEDSGHTLGKTSAPTRFSEADVIEAMKNVARHVTDPVLKAKLQEAKGIGTAATRTNILNKLKKIMAIEVRKNKVYALELGFELIRLVPENLKSPVLTAFLEQKLDKIAQGKLKRKTFIDSQLKELPDFIQLALNADFKAQVDENVRTCEVCGYVLKEFVSKKNGKKYLGCFNDKHTDTRTKFIEIEEPK